MFKKKSLSAYYDSLQILPWPLNRFVASFLYFTTMSVQMLWVNMLLKKVWNNHTFIAAFFHYCSLHKSIKRPGGQGLLHSHQRFRRCSSLTARDWNQMWHIFQMSNCPPSSQHNPHHHRQNTQRIGASPFTFRAHIAYLQQSHSGANKTNARPRPLRQHGASEPGHVLIITGIDSLMTPKSIAV